MRPSLPILLVPLALLLLPSVGGAAGINLAWNDCLPAPGSSQKMPFSCSDDVTVHRLVGSFIPPDGITQLVGEMFTLDLMFPDGPMPDWWRTNVGECRYGSLGVQYAFPGLHDCTNYWGTSASGGFVFTEDYGGDPQHAQLRGVAARSVGGPVSSAHEYYAFQVVITSEHTTAADPPACAGCSQTACLFLESILLTQPPGVGDVTLATPVVSNFASWQCADWGIADPGGILTCTPSGCPVPAARQSWGRIRSLYR